MQIDVRWMCSRNLWQCVKPCNACFGPRKDLKGLNTFFEIQVSRHPTGGVVTSHTPSPPFAAIVTHHQPWYSGQDRGPLASNEVFQQGDLSSSLVMTSPSGRRAPVMASGVRQLPCPYCPMRFKRRWNLNMHVHTHTGERPYQCCYCFRAFADRSNMRKHILIHTCKQPMA
nr:probable transcription factor Ken isoform X10 [Dermacentor andersoni]